MMKFDILSQDHHKGRDQDISNLMKGARPGANAERDRKRVPGEVLH